MMFDRCSLTYNHLTQPTHTFSRRFPSIPPQFPNPHPRAPRHTLIPRDNNKTRQSLN